MKEAAKTLLIAGLMWLSLADPIAGISMTLICILGCHLHSMGKNV